MLGFCFGSHWVGCVCHIVCGHPHYSNSLSTRVRGSLDQGGKKFPGPSGRPALALPGLIRGLEVEPQNWARNFLHGPQLLGHVDVAQWQCRVWGRMCALWAETFGSSCSCGVTPWSSHPHRPSKGAHLWPPINSPLPFPVHLVERGLPAMASRNIMKIWNCGLLWSEISILGDFCRVNSTLYLRKV